VYGPARRLQPPLLLLALLVAACAPDRTPTPTTHRPFAPTISQPVEAGADHLLPLADGEAAFDAIAKVLETAQRTIHLEMYEFQRMDLASLLVEASDRGVLVTAIKDPSERSSRNTWAELEQAGVRVVAFPVERSTIDHVKLLIVDQARAIVGGINWGTRSLLNHDFDIVATGPVVANLERVFQQDLALAGEPATIPPPSRDPVIQVLVTRPGDGIRSAVLSAIRSSRRTIDLAMFVLSDRLVLEALQDALRQGIRLRVLLDPTQPQNSDSMAMLRTKGAAVRLYAQAGDELLHAKLAIFDNDIVLFGSCNWSLSGFTRNHELDVLVKAPALATAFASRLEDDWVASAA
jgi:phosphatidylserine/phosphatidylglycerophosphate/cardiolipin synthase-like enzyme